MQIHSSTASPTTAKIHTVLSNSEQTFITRLYQQTKQLFEKGTSSLLDRKNIQMLSLAVGSGIAASAVGAFALQPVPSPTSSSLPERPGTPPTPPPYQKQPVGNSDQTPSPPPTVTPEPTGSSIADLGMGVGGVLGVAVLAVLIYHCCVGRKNSPSVGTGGGASSTAGTGGSPKRERLSPERSEGSAKDNVESKQSEQQPTETTQLSSPAPQPNADRYTSAVISLSVSDSAPQPQHSQGEIIDIPVGSSFSSVILGSAAEDFINASVVGSAPDPQPLSTSPSPARTASDTIPDCTSNVSDLSTNSARERLPNGATSKTTSPSGSAPGFSTDAVLQRLSVMEGRLLQAVDHWSNGSAPEGIPSSIKNRYLESILCSQGAVSPRFNRLIRSYEDLFYSADCSSDQVFALFSLFHQKNILEIFQERTEIDVLKTCEKNRDASAFFKNLDQANDLLSYSKKRDFKLDHTFPCSGGQGWIACYLNYLRACIGSSSVVSFEFQKLISFLCKTWFQANQISSLLKVTVLKAIVGGRGYQSPKNTKEFQEVLLGMNSLVQQRRKESWENFLARNLSSSNSTSANLLPNTIVPETFAIRDGVSYLRHGSVVDLNQEGEISIVPEYERYLGRMAQEGRTVLYVNHESIDKQQSDAIANLEKKGHFLYLSLPIDHLAIHPEKNRSWVEFLNQPTYQTMWIDGLVELMGREGSNFRLPGDIQLREDIQQIIKKMANSVRDTFFPDEKTWDNPSRYLFLMIFYACIRKYFEGYYKEKMQLSTVGFARTDGKADLGSFVEEAFDAYRGEGGLNTLDDLFLHAITPSLFEQEKCIPDDRCKLLVGVLQKIESNSYKLNRHGWWKSL